MDRLWFPFENLRFDPSGAITGIFPTKIELPWFEGHFPDNPILPGVAYLAAVSAALRAKGVQDGAPVYVMGFRKVRFRRIIRANQNLFLHLAPDGGIAGQWVFEFSNAGGVVCKGTVKTGEVAVSGQALAQTGTEGAQAPAQSSLPPIEELIPHEASMRLAYTALSIETNAAATLGVVKPSWPTADSEGVDTVVVLELLAQTAAAYIGYHAHLRQIGLLVGVRNAFFHQARLPLGTVIRTEVVMTIRVQDYAVFACKALSGATLLSEMELQVVLPSQEDILGGLELRL